MKNRDPKLIREIINRFHSKRFSGKVKRNFHQWLIQPEDYSAKDEAMNELWHDVVVKVTGSVYKSLDMVKAKLGMVPPKKQTVPLQRVLTRVAAVMLPAALIVGSYFIYEAAGNQAEWVRIETPYGKTGCYYLADGTCVWLNAGSSLEYPEKFRGRKREVRLNGEAFFDVTPDKRKPFVVVSDHLRTTVLGTEFNVCSYGNQRHESVTVLSGSVNVTTKDDQMHHLVPDRHLTHWIEDGNTDIEEVDAASMISWLTSGLVFENSTLEDILCGLQRTYNLKVIVDSAQLTNTIYCMKFVNGESLDYVLDVVHSLVGLPYRLEGDMLVIGSDTSNASEFKSSEVGPRFR